MSNLEEPLGEALTIFMRGLTLDASVGLFPHERAEPQPIRIDVELRLSPRRIARLKDTVDYGRIASLSREIALEGHVDLVETLALRIARRCLLFEGALEVRVRVEKPRALPSADGAGVELRLAAGTRPAGATFGPA